MGLLSGGQRQVVSLLMATLAPMKILLLDEHTAALDPKTAGFVLDLTRSIVAEQHLTTMMVTHSMRQALDCGERTIMLHEGRVCFDLDGPGSCRARRPGPGRPVRQSARRDADRSGLMTSGPLPGVVAHADWSMHPGKQWIAVAVRERSGYLALPPEPAGAPETLFARLGERSGEGTALLGVDFPIGLPRAYARLAGIDDFVAHLPRLDGQFYAVARHAAEIGIARPFYPHAPGVKGTVSRRHLLDGLGLDGPAGLRRRCDHATPERRAASPLFWTLGPNQVGRAAIAGWRDLLAPALNAGLDLAIWPFQGSLADLLARHRYVVAESYPAEFYRHLGLPLVRAGSKRRQESRQACASALLAFAQRIGVRLAPTLEQQIRDGFGPRADGEDPFDATVGLFGVLNVAQGHRPCTVPDDPAVTRTEGWILGQSF